MSDNQPDKKNDKWRGRGADKRLQSAKDASAYQKSWFQELKLRVEQGEPCAMVSAGAPEEILRAMDIPFVVNQWWSAVVSSRQKAPYYLSLLHEEGYSSHTCAYCSLPLASTLGEPIEDAPWGGLPKISFVVTELGCDSQIKIYGLWAKKHNIPMFIFERTIVAEPTHLDWWDKSRYDWEDLYQSHRLDLMVAELHRFIAFLEEHTGRQFDIQKLKSIMDMVNQHEEYNSLARNLIAETEPTPIAISDSIPSVMIPQWQRGTEWGLNAAKKLYEEVKEKVESGDSVCADERIRLMWIGVGLWYNTSFYQYFQDEYGAVFVWSMYLAIAADAYVRYGDDPIRTLAARYVSLTDGLRTPPWSTEWYINEAKRHNIKAAVQLAPQDDCAGRSTYFIKKGLEDAGIPVFEISADNVDPRNWNDDEMRRQFSEFLDTRVIGKT